jgi:multisubunit Na+/H+ antiporter MnhG subunit
LTDLESLTCWLTILVTPAHLATAATNGVLAAGARNSGRIFSSTIRTAATILNLTTFGLDSVMIAFGLANLIEKAKNDQLTTLDVLQFFFSHTLIQPKTASGIIKAAQKEHITAYKNAMTDPDAQKAFQDFVDRNRRNHEMTDNSKIVRTINKIDDPNAFFKGLGDMKADLGGRKGRTIIIQDNHSKSHRVNPNQ